jgi:hypothetical protein
MSTNKLPFGSMLCILGNIPCLIFLLRSMQLGSYLFSPHWNKLPMQISTLTKSWSLEHTKQKLIWLIIFMSSCFGGNNIPKYNQLLFHLIFKFGTLFAFEFSNLWNWWNSWIVLVKSLDDLLNDINKINSLWSQNS